MSDNAQLQELLAVLDVCHIYCMQKKQDWRAFKARYDAAKQADAEPKEIANALLNLMLHQYDYLFDKFQHFFFDDTRLERLFRRYRPNWDYFTPQDFEILISALLYLIENRHYATTQTSHDRGIDLQYEWYFRSGTEVVGVAKMLVQCKLYRGTVPVAELRDFFGVVTAEVAEGYFFTTGKITRQGEQFVDAANDSPRANGLHLIDGAKIKRLLTLGDEITNCWREIALRDAERDDSDAWLDTLWDKKDALRHTATEVIMERPKRSVQLALF